MLAREKALYEHFAGQKFDTDNFLIALYGRQLLNAFLNIPLIYIDHDTVQLQKCWEVFIQQRANNGWASVYVFFSL